MKNAEVNVAETRSGERGGKSESGFNCGVFRTPGRRGIIEV